MILASTPLAAAASSPTSGRNPAEAWHKAGDRRPVKRIDQKWLAEERGRRGLVRAPGVFCEFSDFEEQIFTSETIDKIFSDRLGVVPIVFGRSPTCT